MNLWLLLTVNSITLGGLLFLLSAGFSLVFGPMRIPNLTHGSFFMLGAYIGASFLAMGVGFWLAALLSAAVMAVLGGGIERYLLRRLAGQELAQVLVTLGLSFMIADLCLMLWGGDPIPIDTPAGLRGAVPILSITFPAYRLAVLMIAVIVAVGLWLMLDRTRLGAMIRAGVDDAPMARVTGIRVSRLFTTVFCLGAALAGFAGILGGSGSLLGALLGSFIIGFIYNFGQAVFPALAYVILFLPMLIILVFRPQGLFGRHVP